MKVLAPGRLTTPENRWYLAISIHFGVFHRTDFVVIAPNGVDTNPFMAYSKGVFVKNSPLIEWVLRLCPIRSCGSFPTPLMAHSLKPFMQKLFAHQRALDHSSHDKKLVPIYVQLL